MTDIIGLRDGQWREPCAERWKIHSDGSFRRWCFKHHHWVNEPQRPPQRRPLRAACPHCGANASIQSLSLADGEEHAADCPEREPPQHRAWVIYGDALVELGQFPDTAAAFLRMRLERAEHCRETFAWECDDSGVIWTNGYPLLNHTSEAFTGWQGADLYVPDEREAIMNSFQTAFIRRRSWAHTHRLKHADGTWRWVRNMARPVGDNRMIGMACDITGGDHDE
jgi:hypothetical protein